MMMSGFSAEGEEQQIAPGPGLDTVADLERKLAMLRAAETTNNNASAAPAFALPAAEEVKKSTEDSKGGKSALLVSSEKRPYGLSIACLFRQDRVG